MSKRDREGAEHIQMEFGGTADKVVQAARVDTMHVTVNAHLGAGQSGGNGDQSPPTRPSEVAPPPRMFFARHDVLRNLSVLVDSDGAALILIHGWKGIGKSAVVSQWLVHNAQRFPDGERYINLADYHQNGGIAQALRDLLRRLSIDDDALRGPLSDLISRYRCHFADKHGVIVVDNVTAIEQAEQFLTNNPGLLVVAISRKELASLECEPVRVEAFTEAEGLAFLKTSGLENRVEAEPGPTAELLRLCGGFPRHIHRVAAQLKHRGSLRIADFVTELRLQSEPMLAVFDDAYAELSAPAAHLYRLLSVFPGHRVDNGAMCAATGFDEGTVVQLLEELRTWGLVTETGPGLHEIDEAVARHAKACADRDASAQTMRDALLGCLRHYSLLAAYADETIMGDRLRVSPKPPARSQPLFPNQGAAQEWMRKNRALLAALVRQANEAGLYELCWALADNMWAHYTNEKRPLEAASIYHLAAASARATPDYAALSRMLGLEAKSLTDAGEYDAALTIANEAEQVAPPEETPMGARLRSSAIEFQGRAQHKGGYLTSAQDSYQRALAMAPRPRSRGLLHRFLAQAHRQRDETELALSECDRSIACFKQAQDVRNLAISTLEKARLLRASGHKTEAISEFRHAQLLLAQTAAHYYESQAWHEISQLTEGQERIDALWQQLRLLRLISDPAQNEIAQLLRQHEPDAR
ncbi:hypothetical protein [Natronoglycomyces albus]|uniref:NB-ARC domain-containing protein n=1 Tax=Natronoglycomyces albus TaxID=2811108 RepID=A0A895XIQ3_9ACTN|nr:hypothetical protein [Natronoglycomyces albus]QSB05681.1 hypothetical protein JQS30_01770 [Natronoglycomyces albus]